MGEAGLTGLGTTRIEAYLARHRPEAARTLSASHAEPLTLAELLDLAGAAGRGRFEGLSLGYADTDGGPELRAAIAGLDDGIGPDDVAVFTGAQEAIWCVYAALLEPGDHVVTFVPGYEDLWALPRRFGAEVTALPLRREDAFEPDLDRLADALRPDTKLIAVNFPGNPTGATVGRDRQARIVDLASERGAWLFSDEVQRHLVHDPADLLPAAADGYERAVSLDVMSKSFGLPGLRVGWIATRDRDLRDRALAVKTHLSICTGATDEALATIALNAADPILERNRGIVRANLDRLDALFERLGPRFHWTRPTAGCLAFPALADEPTSDRFAIGLAEAEGILLYPESLFGPAGPGFRIGLGRAELEELLPAFERFASRRG